MVRPWVHGLILIAVTTGSVPVAGAQERNAASDLLPQRIYDSRQLLMADNQEPEPALTPVGDRKNPKLAMLFSLILPGLGEQYLGRTGRAKAFFAAEAAIWTSFAVFRIQGSHRQDLYREYARIHAGVSERDDDDYYRTIGNFIASDGPFSANENVRRQARALFPSNPDAQKTYFEDNAYIGEDAWEWVSEERLDQYRDMRSSSLDAFHRSELSLGLLVANRLLSVIDAGILAARRNRGHAENQSGVSWNLEAGPQGPGARITLSRAF